MERKDKARWMRDAFTFEKGENSGEYIKQTNPAYQQAVKKLREDITQAQK